MQTLLHHFKSVTLQLLSISQHEYVFGSVHCTIAERIGISARNITLLRGYANTPGVNAILHNKSYNSHM